MGLFARDISTPQSAELHETRSVLLIGTYIYTYNCVYIYIGILLCPYSKATRLYIRSFDHSSHGAGGEGALKDICWGHGVLRGYSVHFFLRAFEIGKMEGHFLMEFPRAKKYTRRNSYGEPVLGYRSVFGDVAGCLSYTAFLQSKEFDLQPTLDFQSLTSSLCSDQVFAT